MDLIQDWVAQIIIFLLIAMFVDLLLPQSAMQKYIKFAVGLILVLIFLQPLFQIFNADAARVIEESLTKMGDTELEDIKNATELEKKEIQASQRAYILNQTVVQLKELAEGELVEKYGVSIKDIKITLQEDSEEVSFEQVEELLVHIEKLNNSEGGEVEEVRIDIEEETSEEELPVDEIKSDLSSFWEISKDKINLTWEGGDAT